ncbi:hypothetical protein E4U55_007125 [Claviceps digitariae]|nr:hypothetical protein E4U55_007125 [Claviceps digitariae]
MQFSTSAALAVMAIFAGQTLAQSDSTQCVVGAMDLTQLVYTPCVKGPGKWTCQYGAVVTYKDGVYYAQTTPPYGASIAFQCPNADPSLMSCLPSASGEFSAGCPPETITISYWSQKPPSS